jgi:hypothetical protein
MGSYISSNANRFYTAIEATYGQAATVSAANRFPAVRLQAHQLLVPGKRQDKTGSRTFLGISSSAKRKTAFEVRTYLTSWSTTGEPSYGPLFHAGMGAAPQYSSGLVVASMPNAIQVQTSVPHGLLPGAAISYLGEIRFVTGVPTPESLNVSAPFSNLAQPNATLSATITYQLATSLPSVTLYDYWDSTNSINRIVTGAGVDTLEVTVNGDYHTFVFGGPAADLLNASSLMAGTAGLSSFPAEPPLGSFDYSIVPGHLGQVWLGSPLNQYFTLTAANVAIKNNMDLRNQEFGSSYPAAIVPGPREVAVNFTLMVQDDAQTTALYTAAKQRTPIAAMLQLGQQQGQLMAIYLPNMMPELPAYNDAETRLQWSFSNNLAQGATNDEIYIAFA